MEFLLTQEGSLNILKIQGRLDAICSSELEAYLHENLQITQKNLIIDCEHLEFISSSGIRALLGLIKQFKNPQIKVIFSQIPPTIEEVLALSGFTRYFNKTISLAEARKAITGNTR